jgi:purine nucleoside permease
MIMKKIAFAVLSVAVLASSSAFAEGKTRAQVYQELIEAQQNGLNYVTDSSYPVVNPIYAQQVARLQQQAAAASANTNSVAGVSATGSTAN